MPGKERLPAIVVGWRVLSLSSMSPEHPPGSAEGEARSDTRLVHLLGDVGRALRRAALIEAGVVLFGSAVLGLVAGAIASWALLSSSIVAGVEIAFVALALAFILARYGRMMRGAHRYPASVAAWIDRAIPDSQRSGGRVALLSAVELMADRGRFGESVALGDLAIASATQSALSIDANRLVKTEAWGSLRLRLLPIVLSALVIGAFAILGPRHLSTAFGAIASMGAIDSPFSPFPREPRLDDIRLTYRYPAYTERTQRTVNSGGDIHALPGTEVVIETRARDEIAQATLLVSHGEGGEDAEPVKSAVEVDGRRLKATLVVSRAGRFRFRLKRANGETLEERRGHAIELELDDPPEITQIEPQESPLEINEHDRLNLAFDAKDDFGLGDILVSWRIIGGTREGKVPLTSSARGMRRYPGNAQLELAKLNLRPGDRVAYTLEASDNDTVNGPKFGASATHELRVYSRADHHKQVLSLQDEAVDQLVHILGDNLESLFELKNESDPYKKLLDACDAVVERALKADELLKKTVAAVRKDPLGRKAVGEAFEAARTQLLRDAHRLRTSVFGARKAFVAKKAPEKESGRGVQKSQDTMVASLEKNVVYLADLLNDQHMIDAEGLLKELRAQQQALKSALEEYKKAPNDERRKVLAQAIREIKQRINELTEQLAKLKGSVPTEFVNSDALKANDSQARMEAIQKMIEEGNLDQAMAELDNALQQTEEMMASLQKGRSELGSREYSEVTELAEKIWKDLERVEKEQRDLSSKTEKVSKEVLERMKSRLGDAQAFVEKQKKRLQQAAQGLDRAKPGTHMVEGDLHDQAARRIEDGIKAIEARDFGAAKEMVENAVDEMLSLEQDARRRAEQARRFGDLFGGGKSADKAEKELRKARPILDEVLRDIEKLMPSPESLLSKEEKAQLGRQQQRQAALKEQAGKLADDLEKLNNQLPVVGPGIKQTVGEASGAMGQAGDTMGQGDAPGALNHQRRAMDALSRLRQELSKLAQSGKGGGGGGSIPLPFGQSPESPGQQGSEGSGDNFSPERVEIPKPEQYKAPAEFRQDILEAAKQGTVEGYRDAVRRYYEELVK